MTLNEAIEYYDSLAEECRRKTNIERNDYMDLRDESAEYSQLSDWLAELAVLREKVNCSELPNSSADLISRQAAIDLCKQRLYETAINNSGYKCDAANVYSEMAEKRISDWLNDVPSVQETYSGDLIFRQAAKDAYCKHFCHKGAFCPDGYCKEVNDAFDSIQAEPTGDTEQAERKWIQCKKELPKERDWYLGIFKESDTGWVNPIPFVCDYVGCKTKITTKDFWILRENIDGNSPYYMNLECVAWMPLPDLYRGDKE